jgi:hypothetical protein
VFVGVDVGMGVAVGEGVGVGAELQAANVSPIATRPARRRKERRVNSLRSRIWGMVDGYSLVRAPGNGDHPLAIAAEQVQIVRAIDSFEFEPGVPQKQLQLSPE